MFVATARRLSHERKTRESGSRVPAQENFRSSLYFEGRVLLNQFRDFGPLELREELPHLGLRPGLVASAEAIGGSIHRSRRMTSPVERAPLGGIPGHAALIFRANVRQSLRRGRSLRGAAVVLDESVADGFPRRVRIRGVVDAVQADVRDPAGAFPP